MKLMPQTVSSKDIQTSYKAIFKKAMRLKEPIVVLKNNKPHVAIVDVNYLEDLQDKARQAELADALEAIRSYEEDKKYSRLIELNSLEDLLDEEDKKS